MFNNLDLSIALQSTEKSYTLPFKDTSPDSKGLNLLDMLPWQNWVEKWTFLLTFLTSLEIFLLYTFN